MGRKNESRIRRAISDFATSNFFIISFFEYVDIIIPPQIFIIYSLSNSLISSVFTIFFNSLIISNFNFLIIGVKAVTEIVPKIEDISSLEYLQSNIGTAIELTPKPISSISVEYLFFLILS